MCHWSAVTRSFARLMRRGDVDDAKLVVWQKSRRGMEEQSNIPEVLAGCVMKEFSIRMFSNRGNCEDPGFQFLQTPQIVFHRTSTETKNCRLRMKVKFQTDFLSYEIEKVVGIKRIE